MATVTTAIPGSSLTMANLGLRVADRHVSLGNAPESELVRLAVAGDEQAFEHICQKHQNMVFSVVRRMVRRQIDAEDLAQRVFVKVYFSLGKFNGKSRLSTWIYRIALNETYDYLRKLKNQRVFFEGDLGEDSDGVMGDSRISADRTPGADRTAERRDYLIKLMACLSEQDRALMFRKEIHGLTIRELSNETGLNENTIKVRLFRARKKVSKEAEKLSRRSRPDAL